MADSTLPAPSPPPHDTGSDQLNRALDRLREWVECPALQLPDAEGTVREVLRELIKLDRRDTGSDPLNKSLNDLAVAVEMGDHDIIPEICDVVVDAGRTPKHHERGGCPHCPKPGVSA